jgi:tetratricopeptide (TPR) repeat protein
MVDNNSFSSPSKSSPILPGVETWDVLAVSAYRQGNYKEAEVNLFKSLERREESLGEGHLDTLLNYNNYAAALGRLGRFVEAEEYFRKALDGRERIRGRGHPETLITGEEM